MQCSPRTVLRGVLATFRIRSVDRETCLSFDRQDPLAGFRNEFALPEGVIYLDGNSLGALPKQVPTKLAGVIDDEWGRGLIRSWNAAHWIDAPARLGDKIGRLIGAQPGEVIVADSTSVNLFKLLAAALKIQPGRHFVLTEAANFPTDLYVAQGLIDLLGRNHALRIVAREQIENALDGSVAVLMLTHVDYATGAIHDMRKITDAARRVGALMLWDLSHSAGAVPVDLNGCQVDLAIGCGYKYLNGGPGAPAYLFINRSLQDAMQTPISGWMGHAAPFEFARDYRPAVGIKRQLAGTPPVLSMLALEVAIDVWLRVDQQEARRKSMALGDLFIRLVDETCKNQGVEIASPRDTEQRGAQVSVRHPEGYRVMRALIDRDVIGDFRAPDLMRFGFAALYTRYVDVFDAVSQLRDVFTSRVWQRPEYATRLPVT